MLSSEKEALQQKRAAEARAAEVLRDDLQKQVSGGLKEIATTDTRFRKSSSDLHRLKTEIAAERAANGETRKVEQARSISQEAELRTALSEKREQRDQLEASISQLEAARSEVADLKALLTQLENAQSLDGATQAAEIAQREREIASLTASLRKMEEQHAKELSLLSLKEQSMSYLQEKNVQLTSEMREVRKKDMYLRQTSAAATSLAVENESRSTATSYESYGAVSERVAAASSPISPAPAVPSPVQKVSAAAASPRCNCTSPHTRSRTHLASSSLSSSLPQLRNFLSSIDDDVAETPMPSTASSDRWTSEYREAGFGNDHEAEKRNVHVNRHGSIDIRGDYAYAAGTGSLD